MFTFMMLWQPPHFWLLAQFLAEDYKNAGFPVMPIVYGKTYTDYLIMIYSLSLIPFSLYFWVIGIASKLYAITALIIGLAFYLVFIKLLNQRRNIRWLLYFLFFIC